MPRLVQVAAAALLGAVLGCGERGERLQVEGNVTLDGQPVDGGAISFEPPGGAGSDFGAVIEHGSYKAASRPGAQPGKWTVRIRASRKTGKQIAAGSPHPPGTMVDEIVTAPAKYNDKSTLTADLEPGKVNKADFDLQSGAAAK